VAAKYGPWGIVAGGSDGTGIAFGHEMAERGINVILVARREAVLASAAEEIRASHGAEVRTVALDLAEPGAIAALAEATTDLEVGLLVYNAGADDAPGPFLDKDLAAHLAMVRRNCASVLEAAHRFGAPMVRRGRGGLVVVTSGAAWAGGAWTCSPSSSARPTRPRCAACLRRPASPMTASPVRRTWPARHWTTSRTVRPGSTAALTRPVPPRSAPFPAGPPSRHSATARQPARSADGQLAS
jgi:NAD(P)-dependent dehydrogenase (short-subunit alcohol dehydrogenase family)